MEDKKPKVIKANHMLQTKVGSGAIDEKTVQKAQTVMDENDVDFAPLAKDFLDKLQEAIEMARGNDDPAQKNEIAQAMTSPVMQLKANAGTFGFDLVGNMANIMLSFLEAIKGFDEEVIQIVEAHHKTLTAIVLKNMKGDGGAYGKQLEIELKGACKRYFERRKAAK